MTTKKIYVPWSSLRTFGNNKYINSSYLYLFLVPMAANLLLYINPKFTIEIYESTLQLNLTLPFSWIIFYFSALSFTVAALVYFIKAPRLIKTYKDAQQYVQAGMTMRELAQYLPRPHLDVWHEEEGEGGIKAISFSLQDEFLMEINGIKKPNIFGRSSAGKVSYYDLEHKKSLTSQEIQTAKKFNQMLAEIREALHKTDNEVHRLSSVFWVLYNYYEKLFATSRRFCFVFYTLGVTLISIVLLQNLWFVIQYLIKFGLEF